MRGSEMTRIEVFVDAAFAFAVTMLVISFDAIPRTYPEMVIAIKTIPAFVAAVAQLVWIWQAHNLWSERYGLNDGRTIWLSAMLLVVVLIYIYPMRIMLQGAFAWLTDGYLPASFELQNYEELRFMFVFMGTAFVALCITFVMMYRYALGGVDRLLLSAYERIRTVMSVQIWTGCLVIGLMLVVLVLLLPQQWVPLSGFIMFLIGPWIWYVEFRNRSVTKPVRRPE